jgi:hypothetical protein
MQRLAGIGNTQDISVGEWQAREVDANSVGKKQRNSWFTKLSLIKERGRLVIKGHIRTPENRWEGQIRFSKICRFMFGRKFWKIRRFVRKRSGCRLFLKFLSGSRFWHTFSSNLSGFLDLAFILEGFVRTAYKCRCFE